VNSNSGRLSRVLTMSMAIATSFVRARPWRMLPLDS
jgi:hypothetical protein